MSLGFFSCLDHPSGVSTEGYLIGTDCDSDKPPCLRSDHLKAEARYCNQHVLAYNIGTIRRFIIWKQSYMRTRTLSST